MKRVFLNSIPRGFYLFLLLICPLAHGSTQCEQATSPFQLRISTDERTELRTIQKEHSFYLQSTAVPQAHVRVGGHEFRLARYLGGGIEGDVYQAEDLSTGRVVAIKRFHTLPGYLLGLARFYFLTRRGIPCVEVLAKQWSSRTLVMEYVDGVTAETVIFAARYNAKLSALAAAVENAHRRTALRLYPAPVGADNMLVDLEHDRAIVNDGW